MGTAAAGGAKGASKSIGSVFGNVSKTLDKAAGSGAAATSAATAAEPTYPLAPVTKILMVLSSPSLVHPHLQSGRQRTDPQVPSQAHQ